MSQAQNAPDFAPVFCLTPLYHFCSDVPELAIGRAIRILRYDDVTVAFDEVIAKHLQIHEPDHLLWHDPLLSGDCFVEDQLAFLEHLAAVLEQKWSLQERKYGQWLYTNFMTSTARLLQCLRLFKPGRLRAGETFVMWREEIDGVEVWKTLGSGRASAMVVDYTIIASQTSSYELSSVELPFLLAFRENLSPVLRKAESFPKAQLALNLYSEDNGKELDAVGAATALEALLTKGGENNEGLTYRLAMRAANLLGHDASARKELFRKVKSFYDLRSKLVHGAQRDAKLLNRLNELDSLRETLRRVLLSVMALFSEGESFDDLPGLLDELAFDDELRKKVQARAAKFLHIGAGGPTG